MLDTLKAWVCWLMGTVTDLVVNVLVWLIEMLPANQVDPLLIQEIADLLYAFNEAVPVVETAGMFGMYLSFRVTWNAFKGVIWLMPGVGGGM